MRWHSISDIGLQSCIFPNKYLSNQVTLSGVVDKAAFEIVYAQWFTVKLVQLFLSCFRQKFTSDDELFMQAKVFLLFCTLLELNAGTTVDNTLKFCNDLFFNNDKKIMSVVNISISWHFGEYLWRKTFSFVQTNFENNFTQIKT